MTTAQEWFDKCVRDRVEDHLSMVEFIQLVQDDARQESIEWAAKEACGGCYNNRPVEWIGDEPMHILPPELVNPDPPYSMGTHSCCEAWWKYGNKGEICEKPNE